jgi:hypothetical protein
MLIVAQEDRTLWEGLLEGTEGALALEKSYWYLVKAIRHKGKWTYACESQRLFEMTLKQGTIKNHRLEVYQAKKALGIMTRPDGKMTDEYKYLKQRVLEWCVALRTRRL